MSTSKFAAAIALLATLATACGLGPEGSELPTSQPSTSVQVDVAPSRSAVVGRVLSTRNGQRQPLAGVAVRLGRVHWNEQKTDGAFVFEGASGPVTTSDREGIFVIANVEPGDYVLMFGDPLGRYEIISETSGRAKVYSALAGKALDVGTIVVGLST